MLYIHTDRKGETERDSFLEWAHKNVEADQSKFYRIKKNPGHTIALQSLLT
jgi:hypothetical protein